MFLLLIHWLWGSAEQVASSRPGLAQPSQLRDFQTQHQPRLLSGLLEQNGFIAGFTAVVGSVISGPLLSQGSVTKLISWQTGTQKNVLTHTTNNADKMWRIPLLTSRFCYLLDISVILRRKQRSMFCFVSLRVHFLCRELLLLALVLQISRLKIFV